MECNVYKTVKKAGLSKKSIQNTVFFVLKKEKQDGSISVHLVGDAKIKNLNKIYRGKNQTTDVLSFASRDGKDFCFGDDLGDIFISVAQIRRQAKENSVSFRQELIRMLVHGVLHILGYDHQKEKEAKIMFAKQEKYVSDLLK